MIEEKQKMVKKEINNKLLLLVLLSLSHFCWDLSAFCLFHEAEAEAEAEAETEAEAEAEGERATVTNGTTLTQFVHQLGSTSTVDQWRSSQV